MMNLAKSEYNGDQDFDKFLIKIEVPISIFEIRSNLLGIILGLESVPPSWVIEELFLIGTEDGFQFENMKDAEGFHQRFFSLWNDLTTWQNATSAPRLAAIPENITDAEIKYPIHIRQIEINDFLAGLSESGSMSLQETNEKFDKAIISLEEIGDELVAIEEILIEGGDNDDISSAKKLLKESEDIFKNKFPVISQELYKERLKGRR